VLLHGGPDKTANGRHARDEFGSFGTIRWGKTLLYQDDRVSALLLQMEGVGPYGIRNYFGYNGIIGDGDKISDGKRSQRGDHNNWQGFRRSAVHPSPDYISSNEAQKR